MNHVTRSESLVQQKSISITPITENCQSNWLLTWMLTTSEENANVFCHDAAWSRHLRSFAEKSVATQVFVLGLHCTAGLDLCRWQGRFSPAQHTVGNLRRDSLSIYLRQPLLLAHFRVFKAVKSIDQHLKLGPTPCPSWEDMVTSPVSPHTRRITASGLQHC